MNLKVVQLTASNYYEVKKYLRSPEWEHPDFGWFGIKSVDFQTGILIGKRYDKEFKVPIEGVKLLDCDLVNLNYYKLLEKVPSEIRSDLEDVVMDLEQYAAARGYNGCF